jgi:hypothetical protein
MKRSTAPPASWRQVAPSGAGAARAHRGGGGDRRHQVRRSLERPIKDYVFDWDRMLALDGNTAPYLMYAHTRIR